MTLRVSWWTFRNDSLFLLLLNWYRLLHFQTVAILLVNSAVFARPQDSPRDSVETISVADRKQQIQSLRTSDDSSVAVKHLIAIDSDLCNHQTPLLEPLKTDVLIALAEHANPPALEHLRSVFEAQTPRRNDAAYAISLAARKRPASDQDWRYMVRSLTIVEGEQAVSVLKALVRYRRKATRPSWIREAILIGLRFTDKQLPAAVDLLDHWTGQAVKKGAPPGTRLNDYRDWFRESYPSEPRPDLPNDPANVKWTATNLTKLLATLPPDVDSVTDGVAVYIKANCNKCHRHDAGHDLPPDDRLGPNLTSLGWRRQSKEIQSAVLYPSHRLNDEYPVTTVVLSNGKSVSGLMMPDRKGDMKIVTGDLQEVGFAKSDIEEIVPSGVSSMPAGLLEPLSAMEIRILFAFLKRQSGKYAPHQR